MRRSTRTIPLLERLSLRNAAIGVASIISALCLLAMSPTFGFIDGGEMAAAASTLGIPHPTGYPLLMMLGHIAVILAPVRDMLALNILAALLVGAGAGVLVLLFNDLLNGVRTGDEAARNGNTVPYAALAALVTASTPIWWAQGTLFEAYALHALLLPLVMLAFLRYVGSEDLSESEGEHIRITRHGFLFSLVLGLSFANHLTTIVLAPALLIWFFYRFGFGIGAWRRLASLLPGFIVGLLPYLYLPVRSASDPALNWGMPTTFGRFIDHVSGAQYREHMLDFSVMGEQLGWYFSALPGEFAYAGILLALFGVFVLVRHCRPLLLVSGIIFLTGLLYAGTYAIKEIEPYFMIANLVIGFWGAVGLLEIGRRFGAALAVTVGAAAAVLVVALNWGDVNRSGDTIAEDLARSMLETLPKDAILFTTRWDILHSGSLYLQKVENVRPDVSVVNINMLHDRVYLSQVLEENPALKKGGKSLIVFVNERKRFDLMPETRSRRSRQYNVAFYRMVNDMIATSGRPVFVTQDVDPNVGHGWNRVPYRLALLVTRDTSYLPEEPVDYRFRLPSRRADADVMNAALFYASALVARGRYELSKGDSAAATRYLLQAATFDPGIEAGDVPTLPMGNEKYVREGVQFFREIAGSR